MRIPVAQPYRQRAADVQVMHLGNQATEADEQAIVDWVRDSGGNAERSHGSLWVKTPSGWLVVDPDTYVVRGRPGDFSLCPSGLFGDRYEEAD